MITMGVCSSLVVRILVFSNTRWGGSCKILKFDLHAGYQILFFPDFLDQHGINILEWQAHQGINLDLF